MKTPITDSVYPPDIIDREFKAQGRTYGWGTLHDMREVSRRLELDRAALMEALKMMLGCELMGGDQREGLGPDKPGTSPVAKARAALAAASANFPTP